MRKGVSPTKINIYYGGRGVMEDPTIYVLNKMTEVLRELRVEVARYNIFEDKNAIATLPLTLKEADGVILATTVEWFGIGGYMQQFLDMCWLYADKEQLSKQYMLPVVMATTYGERDAELNLVKAWETLGGIPITGLVAYVENLDEFEQNESYRTIIEKRVESLYRTINQKTESLPTSNLAVKTNLLKTRTIDLTPQESEQLSKFVSDETYVKQQKEDIEELSAMFKQMLRTNGADEEDGAEAEMPEEGEDAAEETEAFVDSQDALMQSFISAFRPEEGFIASYAIIISDVNRILHVQVHEDDIKCFYAATDEADVILRTTTSVLNNIADGRTTFQKGFMAGEISAKGNFKTLRMLDTIFNFS
ncbi:MAG: SCP2 sterol-binding domain-containing protein [Lachnospiraceae bacterium]|nr:SCP2 sterol-binding domain-containing protein [Lachnospiraceae bacterium]